MKKQRYSVKLNMLNFVLLLAIVFGVCFGVTYSALSQSKTATGVISIVLPPTSGTTSSNLYIDTNNPAVYLGNDDSGTQITSSTTLLPKLVLTDTQSGNSAYIKIEITILGVSDILSYNTSGATPTFNDSTTMTCTQTTSLITLTTSTAVSEYSYIFLDFIISNLQTADQLTNATLQIKIYSSLDSTFDNKSTSLVYFNLNSSEEIVVTYATLTLNHSGSLPKNYELPTSFQVEIGAILSWEKEQELISTYNGNTTIIFESMYPYSSTVGTMITTINESTTLNITIARNVTLDIYWGTCPIM